MVTVLSCISVPTALAQYASVSKPSQTSTLPAWLPRSLPKAARGAISSSDSPRQISRPSHVVRAQPNDTLTKDSTPSESTFPAVKGFLEDAKSVGLVRVIVNTGMGVLESITTLDKLFYHVLPGKGEYANVILPDENVDFHLLLDKVAKVNLVQGVSMRGNFDTYTMRFFDKLGINGATVFVMWKPGTQGEYAEGQVEAFQALLRKHGQEIEF